MANRKKKVKPSLQSKANKSVVASYPSAQYEPNKWFIIIGLLTILLFTSLYAEWYKPNVQNPWQEGISLIQKANQTPNQEEKSALLLEANDILSKSLQLHPYHARLWLFKGYYHVHVQEWDSVIKYQKKAIQLAAGGILNRIEFDAANMMNNALIQKVNTMKMDTAAIFKLLDSCEVENFENARLHWLRGAIFNQAQDFAQGVKALEKAYNLSSRDHDILFQYGYALSRVGRLDEAKIHLNSALGLQPNNEQTKNLLTQLNSIAP